MPLPKIHMICFRRHNDAPVLTAKPAKSLESATTWLR